LSLPAVVWRRGGSPAAGFLAPGGSRHAFCSSAGWLAAARRNSGRAPSVGRRPFWWLLVVSAFLHFLLFTTLCKSVTCKILFRETNPERDKNGTKPQENKIKNASSPTSLVVDFSFLCKGTILSREKQTKSYKYIVNQPFIPYGHFREDTASASCTNLCCLFQRPVKIRFMPFVHYGISADVHCLGQMCNLFAIIRNTECVFYQ